MSTHKLFHCPNCNAGLDLEENGAAIVRCDYCHSAVIVPESLRLGVKSKEPVVAAEPQKPFRPPIPKLTEEQAVAKVTELVRSGKEVEAMKLYRETYPVGLNETKQAIKQVVIGLPLPIPDARWEDEEDLPFEAAEEITRLAAAGQLEDAAGLYRVTFGTSHIEARTAVEQLVEGKSIDVARQQARRESQATAVRRERPESAPPETFKLMGVGFFFVILFAAFVLMALVLIFVF